MSLGLQIDEQPCFAPQGERPVAVIVLCRERERQDVVEATLER